MLDCEKIQSLPDEPGIYLLKDNAGNVIYVGKATSIKKRIAGHAGHDLFGSPKDAVMIEKVIDLDFIVTHSPSEALILEAQLIKKYRPRYNIIMKDDKSYPYIKVSGGQFPYVATTRRLGEQGARYFGPYTDVASARYSTKMLSKLFGIRTCRQPLEEGTKKRPCLNYHIKRCTSPCSGAIERKEYAKLIRRFCDFLDGKTRAVKSELRKEMEECARRLEYERASALRDTLEALERLDGKQSVVSPDEEELDVLSVAISEDEACVQVMHVRAGQLSGKDHFILVGCKFASEGEIGLSFVKQYYATMAVPPTILNAFECDRGELSDVETWLRERTPGFKFSSITARYAGLAELARKNAVHRLEMHKIEERYRKEKFAGESLEELQYALLLDNLPMRIECFDISNLGESDAVASLVVFEGGRPKKSDYRRFKMRVKGQNDFAMIAEAVQRRYARLLDESAKMPDLVLIDGGRAQVEAACKELDRLGLSLPVAGLAKKKELLFLRSRQDAVRLPADSGALFLVQRARDEAHRFAQAYHKKLRAKRLEDSVLTKIKGIGEKRRKALLLKFGSIEALKHASVEDIACTKGMTRQLAEKLLETLACVDRPETPHDTGQVSKENL